MMNAAAGNAPGRRDILREIAQKRSRRHQGRHEHLLWRLHELERSFAECDPTSESCSYFVVAIVACLEGYVRERVAEFVDAGQPFLGRAAALDKAAAWNFEFVRAVQDKEITVGEFIAHQLSISRLEHVHTNLAALVDKDLWQELRRIKDRWEIQIKGGPDSPMLTDPDKIFGDVKLAFEARHIICHEIATVARPRLEELRSLFGSTVLYLRALDAFLSEVLHPNYPLTQTAMNLEAAANLEVAEKALSEVEQKMRDRFSGASGAFDDAQVAWRGFCEAELNQLVGPREGGGTIWPTHWAANKAELVNKRRQELSRQLEEFEDM